MQSGCFGSWVSRVWTLDVFHVNHVGRRFLETELRVKELRVTIGDQGDIRRFGCVATQPEIQAFHDLTSEAATLPGGNNRDVGNDKYRAVVSDHATHADNFPFVKQADAIQGVRKSTA